MSDTNNIYTTITAPQLTDTKYGENLDTQFNNINSNFTKLGSGAFTKGDKGDSTKAYRLEITDKVKEAYKDDYKKGIIAQAIYMGLDQDGLGPIPISKDTKIEVSVIINDIENPILKSFWSSYVKGDTSWEKSKNYLSDLQNILIDIIPFFYIDKKFYSENLNMPKGEKDKTGIYTFNKLFNRDGLIITFTQNNIQQSIYYDNSKETWCWALGDNETGIPIYQRIIDDKLLIPWGKDNTYHALYNTTGKDEAGDGVGRLNSLAISPCKQNPDGTWHVINLPGWPNEPDNPKTYPELKLDGYYLVHCRRLVGFTGYFNILSASRVDTSNITTKNITISKTNDTDGNITIKGNITADGDINVKNGKILNNSGSIESHAIWGDRVRGKTVEVAPDGTLNVNKTATLNVNGKSTFNGNADFNGETTFNGSTYMTSNLSVQAGFDADRIQTRHINIEIQNTDGNPIESKFEDGKIIFTLPV